MKTLFEQQDGKYEMQGDYNLPCLILQTDEEVYIGVCRERHRRFFNANHCVRYYNLLTAEKEGVTENLKVNAPMKWVAQLNNIRNRATEIVNGEVIYV